MRRSAALFLCAQSLLYPAFLALDAASAAPGVSVALKYLSVLLCLAAALAGWNRGRDGRLTALALCFTALADLFLLVLDRWYAPGVGCFCAVQVCYALRLGDLMPRRVALRLALPLALCPVLWTAGLLTPLNVLALFYFSQLLLNAVGSLRLTPRNGLFTAGLFLFMGCDLCVGLHNLAPALPFAGFGMWFFYLLPSLPGPVGPEGCVIFEDKQVVQCGLCPGAGPLYFDGFHRRAHPVPPLLLPPY